MWSFSAKGNPRLLLPSAATAPWCLLTGVALDEDPVPQITTKNTTTRDSTQQAGGNFGRRLAKRSKVRWGGASAETVKRSAEGKLLAAGVQIIRETSLDE